MLITALRDDGTPEFFKPWLYGSQQCETFFKAVRSCTTYGSTAVNFSLAELLYSRCRKVDTNLLLTASGNVDQIIYPRHLKNLNRYGGIRDDSFVCRSLPSSKDIEETVLQARKDAEKKLNALGIRVDGGDPFGFDSRLAWKLTDFSTSDSTLDSNENFDDECDVLETNCEASCVSLRTLSIR